MPQAYFFNNTHMNVLLFANKMALNEYTYLHFASYARVLLFVIPQTLL